MINFEKWRAGENGAIADYALILPVSEKALLGDEAKEIDQLSGSVITALLQEEGFELSAGDVKVIWVGIKKSAPPARLLLVGFDKNPQSKDFLAAGGKIAAAVMEISGVSKVAFVPVEGFFSEENLNHFGRGFLLRAYRFDRYKSSPTPEEKKEISLTFLHNAPPSAQRKETLETSVQGVFFARDLVSEPPNILFPEAFAQRLKALEKDGLVCEVYDDAYLRKQGMDAFLGVGLGSEHECRLVVMRWQGGPKDQNPVAFIGKGVTFDTGGISLKPAAGMGDMKWDMGGAGAVSGLMKTLAQRKAAVNVVGVVGLVENMPDGKAQRPGDVVSSLSGKTIEVLNTDAEGRLVLADLLEWVQKHIKPDYMVNLATLTGAIIASLGHHYAGLFSNDDALAKMLTEAGEETGERLWRFPMGAEYDADLKSSIADMKNIGGRMAGSITAAQFLGRFVEEGVKWAHLDIAGVTWLNKPTAIAPSGASGFGVRLLDRMVKNEFES